MEDRNLKIANVLFINKISYKSLNQDGVLNYFNSLNISKEDREKWRKEMAEAYFAVIEYVDGHDSFVADIRDFIYDGYIENEFLRFVEYVDQNYSRYPHVWHIKYAFKIIYALEATFDGIDPWDMDVELKCRAKRLAKKMIEELLEYSINNDDLTNNDVIRAQIAMERIRALDI